MSVYSIGYGKLSNLEAKAFLEGVMYGSKAIRFSEDCWFIESPLSQNEVIDTLGYITQSDDPSCTVTELYFGDWLQKEYTPEVITWLTSPRRNWW
ncbi:hypothetical protein HUO09_06210 [Vibrio sp. Y2-5]|uniref:hypothetical protein n=1 Tax=Vibrio TaxID=662 RepID=UPI00142DCD39|nr:MULTISPECIES: hypothetical protein [Vibrio]MBD0785928.1 hypothetical protein [Vibrio sp. Y2-5]NIY92341.1 hypothetical protein [Vibrio diazotrophicus]